MHKRLNHQDVLPDRPTPVLVSIHSGAFRHGDKSVSNSVLRECLASGISVVVITISYRLMQFDAAKKATTTAVPIFPAQLHDAKAAVRWLRANAGQYRIDPERIGVTGRSAGGHPSLLPGLTDPRSRLEGKSGNEDTSSRVQAVANVFGPTDMDACFKTSSVAWIFRLFLGGGPEEATKTCTAASPVTHASEDDPPVLTLHGDQDRLVPLSRSRALDDAQTGGNILTV